MSARTRKEQNWRDIRRVTVCMEIWAIWRKTGRIRSLNRLAESYNVMASERERREMSVTPFLP